MRGVNKQMEELPCQKIFELMFTAGTAAKMHNSLMKMVNFLLDDDVVGEVKWPWAAVYGQASTVSFKVYIIWGVDSFFVARYGNVFYVGFSFQLCLSRIRKGSYTNAKLEEMLSAACFCTCVCAIDFSSCGDDFAKFRKSVYRMETLVYTWFSKMQIKLLNKTLHKPDCECTTCVSGLCLNSFEIFFYQVNQLTRQPVDPLTRCVSPAQHNLFAAAKKYGIPRSTLFNKLTGKTSMGKKPGPSTVLLPEEEQMIEKWLFGLAARGFPVTKRQLLRSIQLYLNINKRKTVFRNNLPGRKWYNSFRQRHKAISERISQNLTPRRAAVSAENIKAWHSEVSKYCEEHDLLDVLNDPSRVFNMDEKGFVLTPSNEVVLVPRADKAVYNRSKNDEKECVSSLLGGNAAGKMTPPMMIHSYKRMPSAILATNPAKWSVGISDSGWQTQQTFHDYMVNIFYRWLLEEKIQLPVILFIDGHKSHVSLTLSDFCAEHKIELIALFPNSTHLTQPMDVRVFKPLNTSWSKQAKDWRVDNQYARIEKKDVAPILEKSINAINYSELLRKAFRKSGIYPFDAANIDLSRVLPSILDSASPQEELWNPKEPENL